MSKNGQNRDSETSNSIYDLKCKKTMEQTTCSDLCSRNAKCGNSRICHRPKRKNTLKSFCKSECVPKFPELLPVIPSLVLTSSTDNDISDTICDDGLESDSDSDGISLEDIMRNRRKKGSLLYDNYNSALEGNSKKVKTSNFDHASSCSLDFTSNQSNSLRNVVTKTIENIQVPKRVTNDDTVTLSLCPKVLIRPTRKHSIRRKMSKQKSNKSLLKLPLTASPLPRLNGESHTSCTTNNNIQLDDVLSHINEKNKVLSSLATDHDFFHAKTSKRKGKFDFIPSHFPFFTFTPPSAIENGKSTNFTELLIESKFEKSCLIKNSEKNCTLQTPRKNISSDLVHPSMTPGKKNSSSGRKSSLSPLNDNDGISRISYFFTPV